MRRTCELRIADCGLQIGERGRLDRRVRRPAERSCIQPPRTCPGNKEGREPPMKKFERNLAATVYALYYKARVNIQDE
jgi:hypothetical protein